MLNITHDTWPYCILFFRQGDSLDIIPGIDTIGITISSIRSSTTSSIVDVIINSPRRRRFMVASLPTKELVQIDTTIRQVRSPFAKIAVDAAFFVGDYPSCA